MATNAHGTRATLGTTTETTDVETGAGTTIETVIAIGETATETETGRDAQNHDLGRDTATLK